jgi:hypothetical protein
LKERKEGWRRQEKRERRGRENGRWDESAMEGGREKNAGRKRLVDELLVEFILARIAEDDALG